MTTNIAPNPLQEMLESGEFFHLRDADAVHLIHSTFGPELERLKNAPPASEPGSTATSSSNAASGQLSPSRLLFDADFDEVNRTLVGMLALKWLIANDYDTFTSTQHASTKLSRESFTQFQHLCYSVFQTPEDFFSLLVATVVNDLGKDPTLATDLVKVTGRSINGLNHDMVVYEAAQVNLVPCLQLLDEPHRKEVMLGLEFSANLNIAQFVQAENVPGSLSSVFLMTEHALNSKLLEQLLDVAGSAGHREFSSAKPMSEPVFQAFMTAHQALLDVLRGHASFRKGYDEILVERSVLLDKTGFQHLSIDIPEERALLRLLTMGRTADRSQADCFADAFYSLPNTIRQSLVQGLNVDGIDDGKAILPYYMPALISEGLKNARNSTSEAKKDVLVSLMTFLTRVLDGTKPLPGQQGVIVERNLLFAKDTVRSDAFRMNPKILDQLQIPSEA